MAAEALGMTTAERKKLENSESKLTLNLSASFGQYMLKFEDDAEKIADAPVEAGAVCKRQ